MGTPQDKAGPQTEDGEGGVGGGETVQAAEGKAGAKS